MKKSVSNKGNVVQLNLIVDNKINVANQYQVTTVQWVPHVNTVLIDANDPQEAMWVAIERHELGENEVLLERASDICVVGFGDLMLDTTIATVQCLSNHPDLQVA
jgi:hypothetical protein